MSAIITISLLSLSSFILGTVLFFLNSSSNNNNVIYAQFQNNNSNALLGVNITSPEKGQQIPVGNNLTVSGKSTDEPTSDDCQVSVIVNSIKPYQPATANGTIEGGKNDDYSKWFFVLSSNYTSIKEGVNEITAKLSCLSSISNNNTTKWYSINVTGIATAINNNITFPPQSSSVISLSNQDKSNNNSDPQSSETNMNELQEPIFDINNDDNNDEIHEEVKKLRDKIIEGVKETLERQGIEWNVPSSLK